MSDLWSPGTALRARRFSLITNDDAGPPLETIVTADLYAQGFAEGQRATERAQEDDRLTILELVASANIIQQPDPEPLAILLSETVLGLLENIVGQAPVDADLLRRRALVLADAICSPASPAVLTVRDADIALLEGLRDDIEVRGDPTMARGALRFTAGQASAEDGPGLALERLRDAMRTLEGL